MTSRRQPPGAGASERGQDTRERLLEAALDVFGRQGFEGASTRQLADRAGTNLAAIPYHFGSKQGLHEAVAVHIAERMVAQLGPLVEALRAEADGPLAPAAVRALLHRLLDRFADILLGQAEAERWARFIIREQMTPSPAFDVLYARIMQPMHGLSCRLLGTLLGRPAEEPAVMIQVFALFGQILIFRAARAATQRRLQWDSFTEARIAMVKDAVRRQLDALLAAEGVA
jgi:AcrR family transcriptional regulator